MSIYGADTLKMASFGLCTSFGSPNLWQPLRKLKNWKNPPERVQFAHDKSPCDFCVNTFWSGRSSDWFRREGPI